MRGGSSPCGAGFVLADANTPIYPDRSGGERICMFFSSVTTDDTTGYKRGARVLEVKFSAVNLVSFFNLNGASRRGVYKYSVKILRP